MLLLMTNKLTSRPHSKLGGRPSKFDEPSRPVTMTLPERVLRLLSTLDSDRARAIVKLTDCALAPPEGKAPTLVELVQVSPTKAIILVANSRYLRTIPWLRLVEVAPAKNLLTVPPGTPIEKLEITIGDLLDDLHADDPVEHDLLESLRKCLSGSRRKQMVTKGEILFIEQEADVSGKR
jgi:hypothetical protein